MHHLFPNSNCGQLLSPCTAQQSPSAEHPCHGNLPGCQPAEPWRLLLQTFATLSERLQSRPDQTHSPTVHTMCFGRQLRAKSAAPCPPADFLLCLAGKPCSRRHWEIAGVFLGQRGFTCDLQQHCTLFDTSSTLTSLARSNVHSLSQMDMICLPASSSNSSPPLCLGLETAFQ